MRTTILAAAAAAVLSFPAPVRAQDVAPVTSADTAEAPPRTALQKGTWSLSFVAPGYSGGERAQFAIWEMMGSRTNVGLALELSVSGRDRDQDGDDVTEASTGAGMGINVRRYAGAERAVMPFVQGGVFGRGGYSRREGDSYDADLKMMSVGVEAGIGAEWFPVRHFSLSGYTGARLSTSRYEEEYTGPDETERTSSSTEGAFQAFTSALSVSIYF
jgi:hypothetical protein